MILGKTETFILNIDQMSHRWARHKLLKQIKTIHLDLKIQTEWLKLQQSYLLKVQLPKQALPYLISFISFHHYRIFQIVPYQLFDTIQPIHERPFEEHRFEVMIDGLNDPFIKDKVIDILNDFQDSRIMYNFTQDILKITTTSAVMCGLIHALATRNVDIYHVHIPVRTFPKIRISSHL
ncbi:hypothetical protein [Staphylococcus lutrae]|uniref:Uncharacterized protein n=2 Tax=Staphylococcus lutrae TaxID=155085 RepID=A0AAC9RNK8_9STAP|nr:hypothetical protein [Staphylococcus lutrae]ARJ50481.1 hypothetical protein B5P37_03720 [Staphylococcus lutrae]PNZ38209.1 hypothetical protein CD134_04985 [Staphylococcus lutrae]